MELTEEQSSPNAETMLSEPITPIPVGYPDVHEFDELMRRYVHDLSPKKQDKALIHASRAANIKSVLIDKKTTSIESAQFRRVAPFIVKITLADGQYRFWVKKMFTLQPNDPNLPEVRRGTSRNSPPECDRSPEEMTDPQSPEAPPKSFSRKNSSTHKNNNASESLQLQEAGFNTSATFEQQNRWMTPLPPQDPTGIRTTNLTSSNTLNTHDGYSRNAPMPLTCTNATPPGLSFSVNPFVNNSTTSTAYNTGPIYKVPRGHHPAGHDYEVKLERNYM
ncbi:hypothetical protein LTR84_012181 [Exophiala bonariae]|uniref:Uncharacterized protein n=1 Tax=Exophiala bonariae TaxID=1690606 RepID=A0AAV9NFF7_9EURO|nr:hypothetical protein LTR84_012181 [Exophiala bonariae]